MQVIVKVVVSSSKRLTTRVERCRKEDVQFKP
jgi:hypothetical protein